MPHRSRKPRFQTLTSALRGNDVDCVRGFLDRGCDPNEATKTHIPCLTTAIRHSPESIGPLLRAGADVHATDVFGRTPLFAAVIGNNLHAVRQLCESIQECRVMMCWFYSEPRFSLHTDLRRVVLGLLRQRTPIGVYLNRPDLVSFKPATHFATTVRMAKVLHGLGPIDTELTGRSGASLREYKVWDWLV